jgi:hypothetical protein
MKLEVAVKGFNPDTYDDDLYEIVGDADHNHDLVDMIAFLQEDKVIYQVWADNEDKDASLFFGEVLASIRNLGMNIISVNVVDEK